MYLDSVPKSQLRVLFTARQKPLFCNGDCASDPQIPEIGQMYHKCDTWKS